MYNLESGRRDWRKDIQYVRVLAECRVSVKRIIDEYQRLWREEDRVIRIITSIITSDVWTIRRHRAAMPKRNPLRVMLQSAYPIRTTLFIYRSIKNSRLNTFSIRDEAKPFKKGFTYFWSILAVGCVLFTILLCKYLHAIAHIPI